MLAILLGAPQIWVRSHRRWCGTSTCTLFMVGTYKGLHVARLNSRPAIDDARHAQSKLPPSALGQAYTPAVRCSASLSFHQIVVRLTAAQPSACHR